MSRCGGIRSFNPDGAALGSRISLSATDEELGDFEAEAILSHKGTILAVQILTVFQPGVLPPAELHALDHLHKLIARGHVKPNQLAEELEVGTLARAIAFDLVAASDPAPLVTIDHELRKTAKQRPAKQRWSIGTSFVMEAVQ